MDKRLLDLVIEVYGSETLIDENTSLSADLSFDSIQYIKLIVNIESEYGFDFDEEYLDLDKLDRLGEVMGIINLHISRQEQ